MELEVDEGRVHLSEVMIPVQAMRGGVKGFHDIMHLKRESLIAWLRSRDVGDEGVGYLFRERVILICFGHSPL